MFQNKLSHLLFCQRERNRFFNKKKSFVIKNIKNPKQKKIFLNKYVTRHNLTISKLSGFPVLLENVDYKTKTFKKSDLLKKLKIYKKTLILHLNLNKKFLSDDFKMVSKILKANRKSNKIKFLTNNFKVVLIYCGKKNSAINYQLDFLGMTGLTFEVQSLNKIYKYCKKNNFNMSSQMYLKAINKLKIFFVRLNSGLIIEVLQKI